MIVNFKRPVTKNITKLHHKSNLIGSGINSKWAISQTKAYNQEEKQDKLALKFDEFKEKASDLGSASFKALLQLAGFPKMSERKETEPLDIREDPSSPRANLPYEDKLTLGIKDFAQAGVALAFGVAGFVIIGTCFLLSYLTGLDGTKKIVEEARKRSFTDTEDQMPNTEDSTLEGAKLYGESKNVIDAIDIIKQ
jgi:hypothetical protein